MFNLSPPTISYENKIILAHNKGVNLRPHHWNETH